MATVILRCKMAAGIILSSLFAAEIVVQIANLVVANHNNGGPYIHTYIYTFIHAYILLHTFIHSRIHIVVTFPRRSSMSPKGECCSVWGM